MTNKTFKILIPDILNSCVNWYNRAGISLLVTTMKKEWCSLAASLLLEQTQGRGVLTAKGYSTWTCFLCVLKIPVLVRKLRRGSFSLRWVLGPQHSHAPLMPEQFQLHSLRHLMLMWGYSTEKALWLLQRGVWWGCIFWLASLVWAVGACLSVPYIDKFHVWKR